MRRILLPSFVVLSMAVSTAFGQGGADEVIAFFPGDMTVPPYDDPTEALGDPDYDPDTPEPPTYCALGWGGVLDLRFNVNPILTGGNEEPDLEIIEIAGVFEEYRVFISFGFGWTPIGTYVGPALIDLDAIPSVIPGIPYRNLRIEDTGTEASEAPFGGADIDAAVSLNSACPLEVALGTFLGLSSSLGSLTANQAGGFLNDIRSFRDDVLKRTPAGQTLIRQYYAYGPELKTILRRNPTIGLDAFALIGEAWPVIQNRNASFSIPAAQLQRGLKLIASVERHASPELAGALAEFRELLNPGGVPRTGLVHIAALSPTDSEVNVRHIAARDDGTPRAVILASFGIAVLACFARRRQAVNMT